VVAIEQRVDAILNHAAHPHQEYPLTDDFAQASGLDSRYGGTWDQVGAQQLSQGVRVDRVGPDLGAAAIARTQKGCASSTCSTWSLAANQSYITPQFQPASSTAVHGSPSDWKNFPTVRPSLANRAVARVRPPWSMTCTCEYRLW
jgi:hypothetical protein